MMEGFGAGSVPYLWLTDPGADLGGPKTHGSYRSWSESTTLVPSLCVYTHTQNRGGRREEDVWAGSWRRLGPPPVPYTVFHYDVPSPFVCRSTCCSRCRCTWRRPACRRTTRCFTMMFFLCVCVGVPAVPAAGVPEGAPPAGELHGVSLMMFFLCVCRSTCCSRCSSTWRQCCGSGSESGSTGSTCFWASQIRIH